MTKKSKSEKGVLLKRSGARSYSYEKGYVYVRPFGEKSESEYGLEIHEAEELYRDLERAIKDAR